jgi:glycerophosphoryl diester phosphodiesterase
MAALDGQIYPPNSLEAIRACLDADAPFIEIDATALADEDYLLVHDPVLESETTGRGAVGACTAAQARTLHYRPRRVGEAPSYRVPLLGEVGCKSISKI